MSRLRNVVLLALALALGAGTLLATPPAAFANGADATYSLRAGADSAVATLQQKWNIELTVHNGGTYGLFLDSLALVTTPESGPGAGKATRSRLYFSMAADAVSSGEDHKFNLSLPASRVASRLELQVYGHTRDVPVVALSTTVAGGAFDPAALYPAMLVRVDGRAVELTRVPANADLVSGSGVLMLREEGSDGIAEFQTAMHLAAIGHTVVMANPPGTGRSEGPADFSGPASMAGALAALDTLAHSNGVDPARLAVWGTGTGGTLALLLAARRPELKAVIVQSAPMDPWAAYRALPEASRKAFVAAAGRDSAAWRARSPLAAPVALKAAVLVLHGEKDDVAPAGAAHALVAALLARSVVVEAHFDAAAGHDFQAAQAFRFGQRFVKAHTTPSP